MFLPALEALFLDAVVWDVEGDDRHGGVVENDHPSLGVVLLRQASL